MNTKTRSWSLTKHVLQRSVSAAGNGNAQELGTGSSIGIDNCSVESNVVCKEILLSSSSLTFLVLEVVCWRNTRDWDFEFRIGNTEMLFIVL